MDEIRLEVKDTVKEVNLKDVDNHKLTYINGNQSKDQ